MNEEIKELSKMMSYIKEETGADGVAFYSEQEGDVRARVFFHDPHKEETRNLAQYISMREVALAKYDVLGVLIAKIKEIIEQEDG